MKEFFNVFLCAIFLQAFFSCNKGDRHSDNILHYFLQAGDTCSSSKREIIGSRREL